MLRKRLPQRDVAAELVKRVLRALETGKLTRSDLTARTLAQFLGQTTSVLYHHFGSLEGFLYAVSIEGFVALAERLEAMERAGAGPVKLAEAYLTFGLDNPVLYRLMLADEYDWDALAHAGQAGRPAQLRPWHALVAYFERNGSADPDGDARVFQACAHGIILLTLTGRITTGTPRSRDHEVALRVVRRLATLLTPAAGKHKKR